MTKPKKWTEVYPQGTKEGDEEQKFFYALARNKKYSWKGVSMLAAETGLSKKRVQEIINKYAKSGIVIPSPHQVDLWGYWERHPTLVKDPTPKSLTKKDQENRINANLDTN